MFLLVLVLYLCCSCTRTYIHAFERLPILVNPRTETADRASTRKYTYLRALARPDLCHILPQTFGTAWLLRFRTDV